MYNRAEVIVLHLEMEISNWVECPPSRRFSAEWPEISSTYVLSDQVAELFVNIGSTQPFCLFAISSFQRGLR